MGYDTHFSYFIEGGRSTNMKYSRRGKKEQSRNHQLKHTNTLHNETTKNNDQWV